MMNRLSGMVMQNPMLLLWIAGVAFLAGVAAGGGTAWTVQGWRLDAVQSKFDGFVATVKAQGEAAEEAKRKQVKIDKLNKEQTDAQIKRDLDRLRADNQRLRDERAASRFVPATASPAGSPDRACFDRPQLESAIQLFDSEIQGIVEQGSEAVIKLDAVKVWAQRR